MGGGKLRTILFAALLVVPALALAPSIAHAGPCLTTPTDPPGGVLGATIQTFIDLGVNPAVTCIRNELWSDPAGFKLGTYVKGADGMGGSPDPTVLTYDGSTVDGTFAGNANKRDFFWVQDNGNTKDFGGGIFGGAPSAGIVWDLGGPANKAVVFVQVDHPPLPGEVLENTAWLSNDPDAADGGWTQANLKEVWLQGWSPNPNIVDGFVAVYELAGGATFRYVSVTHGGPGAVLRDGDNEIDAVGGLNRTGGCVDCPETPEPNALLLFGTALLPLGAGALRRRQRII